MHTKDRILQSSFLIFLNKGYENSSMNDLVRASGMSKGAFYYYFPNKKALYIAVIDRFILSYYKDIRWEEYEGLSLREKDKKIKSFYLNFVKEINKISNNGLASYYMLFFEAYKLHPGFIKEIQNYYFRLKTALEHVSGEESTQTDAVSKIAKYEGMLFWILLFPEENIEKLLS